MQRIEGLKAGLESEVVARQEGIPATAYVRPRVVTMTNVSKLIRGAHGSYSDGCGTWKTDKS